MTPADIAHLRRCIELAREARGRGDQPFGSLLAGGDGAVLAERSNEVVTTGDRTAHPELWLAAWASRHLTADECRAATMYTSAEHCAMCASAHVWAGIGRLVFVLSSEMVGDLMPPGPAIGISSREVVARSTVDVVVEGPVDELLADAAALFR